MIHKPDDREGRPYMSQTAASLSNVGATLAVARHKNKAPSLPHSFPKQHLLAICDI
jgi:hypothetical protein